MPLLLLHRNDYFAIEMRLTEAGTMIHNFVRNHPPSCSIHIHIVNDADPCPALAVSEP
jgi:hypothetical protein